MGRFGSGLKRATRDVVLRWKIGPSVGNQRGGPSSTVLELVPRRAVGRQMQFASSLHARISGIYESIRFRFEVFVSPRGRPLGNGTSGWVPKWRTSQEGAGVGTADGSWAQN